MSTAAESRSLTLGLPVHVGATFGLLKQGSGDPTIRIRGNQVWRATRTPEGPCTWQLAFSGDRVTGRAWGPGAAWVLSDLEGLCGQFDGGSEFSPEHPKVAALHRDHQDLRFCRTRTILDTLVPAILGQKIHAIEAHRIWRNITYKLGETPPGPETTLRLPPSPERLAETATWTYHQLGLERRRAELLVEVGRRAARLEEASAMVPADLERRLQSLQGIGPWTTANVRWAALGDPDAIPILDFHIKNTVSWHLAGEPRGDDARMLELLEPFTGHRGRVVRLLHYAGAAPKYGPRMAVRKVDSL